MRKLKVNKGITLIALIITIIVMLILVGVTVNVILNEGLFDKAKEATSKTEQAKEKELIQQAYINYEAGKLISGPKTEDLEALEEYFLGKDINKLEQNMDGDIITFEQGAIWDINNLKYISNTEVIALLSYENDLGVSNDYLIKIVESEDGTAIIESIEMLKPIELGNDATVQGNEFEGWTITFENGNEYVLSGDGKITNKWWEMKEGESFDNALVAMEPYVIMAGSEAGDGKVNSITMSNGEKIYVYAVGNGGRKEIAEDPLYNGAVLDPYKWYIGDIIANQGGKNFVEYKGASPINMSDFTDDKIYCKSYLERIIASFE